jgi:hypothetical protein
MCKGITATHPCCKHNKLPQHNSLHGFQDDKYLSSAWRNLSRKTSRSFMIAASLRSISRRSMLRTYTRSSALNTLRVRHAQIKNACKERCIPSHYSYRTSTTTGTVFTEYLCSCSTRRIISEISFFCVEFRSSMTCSNQNTAR